MIVALMTLLLSPPPDVFASVNEIRSRHGLPEFIADPELAVAAQEISEIRANRNWPGHLPEKRWRQTNARSEGVGMRSGKDLSGKRFLSCCLFDRRWRYAGVGVAFNARTKRTFYTLLVR